MKGNPYLLAALLILSLLGVLGVVVVVIRVPINTDRLVLIGAIFGFLSPTIVALVALVRAEQGIATINGASKALHDHLEGGTDPHGP